MKIEFYRPTKDEWEFHLLPNIFFIHSYDVGDSLILAWLFWSLVWGDFEK